MHALRQSHLPGFGGLGMKEFGGSQLRGNAREQRPVAIKRPMHLVLKSSLAVRELSFLRQNRASAIEALVFRLGRKSGVRVYRFANSGNHLHILLRASSRQAFHRYVRSLSGLIARMVLGAERGSAQGLKFWDARPFTRIVEWGRDFKNLGFYILQNTLEATGFMPYQQRNSKVKVRPGKTRRGKSPPLS